MKTAIGFYVFDRWRDAPSYAFGKKDEPGIVPQADKDTYWEIYSEILDAAQTAKDKRDDGDKLFLRPKQYSKERGSRGHRPVDLWVSICATGADTFGYMPQVYVIASERGIEVGFAASITEDDYFDAEVKARNRTIVPFINAKLPAPPAAAPLDQALALQGGWHFNLKTRLTTADQGFDQFSSLSALLAFLKQSNITSGGGCVCRIFSPDQLYDVDVHLELQLALDNFASLLSACSPSPWDVDVRQAQTEVEVLAKVDDFDPTDVTDGRKRVLSEVARRQGQKRFREVLLDAYDGKCAVTGMNVADVLQAAHITPYLGPATNHVTNGILLRADLHTLFDIGLIRINPNTMCVTVSDSLSGTDYWKYNGSPISLPALPKSRPSAMALAAHFGNP